MDSGHFGFTSTEGGNYMACFWTADQKPPVTTTVEFNWNSGIATTEWAKVVKRNKIDVSFYPHACLSLCASILSVSAFFAFTTKTPTVSCSVQSMAMELKVMGKTVESIHEEMLHLRQR